LPPPIVTAFRKPFHFRGYCLGNQNNANE